MNEQKIKILTREEAIDLLDNQIEYTFQLEKQNIELHNKIDKAIEYISSYDIALEDKCEYDYHLLKILKGSDVDE